MFTKTTTELAPEEDQGALFAILNAPRYATEDYVQLYTDRISDVTSDIPEVTTEFSIVGDANFYIWVLEEWSERDRSQAEVQQDIQARLAQLPGVEGFVFAPPTLPGAGGGLPITVVVQSIFEPQRVYEVAEAIRAEAQATGRFIVVQNSLAFDSPEVTVTIDRDSGGRPQRSGVRDRLDAGAAGRRRRRGPVRPRVQQLRHHHPGPPEFRDNPERLGEFFVRAATGEMVPLSSVVSITDRAPRPRRSSSSTSSTPRPSRRCPFRASRPARAWPPSWTSPRRS
jgi:multidrug efflux pump